MNTFLILLSTVLFSFNLTAQIEGIVLDRNNAPIPYANIGIKNTAKGTVSDLDGLFFINNAKMEDTILLSALGFTSKEVLLGNLDTVFLDAVSYEIPIVEIIASVLDKDLLTFGKKNKKRGESVSFSSPQLGACIAAPIPIDDFIKVEYLNFVINHATGDSMLFRIQLFEFWEGEIGGPILKRNLLVREKQKKGVVSIDVSDQAIILNSDVLMSLEWLHDFDEKGNEGLTFDTKKGKKYRGIYYKYSNTDSWKIVDHMKKKVPCFFIEGYKIED